MWGTFEISKSAILRDGASEGFSDNTTLRDEILSMMFGDADTEGGVTNNTYNTTYNIVNPTGTVTDALERSAREAEIDRMRNG